jgi:hypothetical protein
MSTPHSIRLRHYPPRGPASPRAGVSLPLTKPIAPATQSRTDTSPRIRPFLDLDPRTCPVRSHVPAPRRYLPRGSRVTRAWLYARRGSSTLRLTRRGCRTRLSRKHPIAGTRCALSNELEYLRAALIIPEGFRHRHFAFGGTPYTGGTRALLSSESRSSALNW